MFSALHVCTQPLALEGLARKDVKADVLRLDSIHSVVSGNKWFKLKYYIADALQRNQQTVATFGGAWSNHIVATAYACREAGLKSIGVIRGERAADISITLRAAMDYGMQLDFIDRSSFQQRDKSELINRLTERWGPLCLIPEGGAGGLGVKGSREILELTSIQKYSHVLCAIGTGTMFTGLVNGSLPGQKIIGVPVLKGMKDLPGEYSWFFEDPARIYDCQIFYDYHFGGYAKRTPALIRFMNEFYKQTGVPTDFVYTAKLMFAFTDLLHKDHFPPASRILIIHSGGLQGNSSLPPGTLVY